MDTVIATQVLPGKKESIWKSVRFYGKGRQAPPSYDLVNYFFSEQIGLLWCTHKPPPPPQQNCKQ